MHKDINAEIKVIKAQIMVNFALLNDIKAKIKVNVALLKDNKA